MCGCVRQLNMAINKQAIIDAVFQGEAEAAKNPIPPTIWSYNEATVDDAYDPAAARAMLAEAGGQRLVYECLGNARSASVQSERTPYGGANPS